jgi:hypothetical protein
MKGNSSIFYQIILLLHDRLSFLKTINKNNINNVPLKTKNINNLAPEKFFQNSVIDYSAGFVIVDRTECNALDFIEDINSKLFILQKTCIFFFK